MCTKTQSRWRLPRRARGAARVWQDREHAGGVEDSGGEAGESWLALSILPHVGISPCTPGRGCPVRRRLRAFARVQVLLQTIKPGYCAGEPAARPIMRVVRLIQGRMDDALRR